MLFYINTKLLLYNKMYFIIYILSCWLHLSPSTDSPKDAISVLCQLKTQCKVTVKTTTVSPLLLTRKSKKKIAVVCSTVRILSIVHFYYQIACVCIWELCLSISAFMFSRLFHNIRPPIVFLLPTGLRRQNKRTETIRCRL